MFAPPAGARTQRIAFCRDVGTDLPAENCANVGPPKRLRPAGAETARLSAGRRRAVRYFDFTLDVIESITVDAILNCSLRLLIPWRRAIQSKSVYAVHTSPLSFSNTSSRTGQSRPALALAVMNCVPSGGFPKISSTDGCSLIPASAASFD